ncbi:hypothetical protein SSYM_2564, partial [Serratia symbiotica str. Tucson]
ASCRPFVRQAGCLFLYPAVCLNECLFLYPSVHQVSRLLAVAALQ